MSKRGHGEGSVSKRKDGRWQASLQVNGTRRTVYGKTAREVRFKLRELQREADTTGSLTVPVKHTLNELLDTWLDTAPDLKQSTRSKYRWFLGKHVRPAVGNLSLKQLTPERIQKLYAAMTPATAERVHRILHRAFEIAVMWRWLPENPCDRVLKPVHRAKRKILWTREELEKFLANTQDRRLYPAWVLLLATGCRLGEILALHWEDVQKESTVLQIGRTLHRVDGEWLIDTPKTVNALRAIILPDIAVDALRLQRQQQAEWRERAGAEWEEWRLVFTSMTGSPMYNSAVRQGLRRNCIRLGLPIMTPHGLRHLHASLLLNEGVPVTAVSARLGHANPQITMKIYAHAMPGQDDLAAQAIGNVLGNGDDDGAEPDEVDEG